MSKQLASEMSRAPNQSSPKHHHWTFPQFYLRLSLVLLAACATLFILSQIQFLQPPPLDNSHPTHAFSFVKYQWLNTMKKFERCSEDVRLTAEKLRRAVTFLPLKDLRYMQSALQGHTWFLSSMYDTQEEGEVQFQHFPSESSDGRLLCLKGRDNHDGSWNSYALAYPETLPYNATMMDGLTFVSYNHYNYDNIWHGLSAMVPFVAWHIKNGCSALPNRWVLYHWGELRSKMGPWLTSLMDATFDGSIDMERFDDREDNHPSCFEEAVVMRHNEGGMSRDKRLEVYDLMRCKARTYCNVTRVAEVDNQGAPLIGLTMFMRTGPRSFRNQSAVVEIFNRECKKVAGCQLTTAHSNNLTFCEQVKLMSMTDILVSPHGAQLTNMFLMDRNSSVMEFFPKGWLKLAGVGQYVHHWIASWSGMRHQGAYRDPNGEPCPYGEDDRRCMTIYKSGLIGHNETYFGEWARNVLNEVKISKTEGANKRSVDSVRGCACH